MPTEKPSVSAGFLTAYPRCTECFGPFLKTLLSGPKIFTPELVELGRADNYAVVPFNLDKVDELVSKWETQSDDRPGWILRRNSPFQVSILISKPVDFLRFNFVNLNVERSYLNTPEKNEELLSLLTDSYNLLHPAYGDVRINEMTRTYLHALGKVKLGTDLERALPEPYWAIFLGPEYVEMFGVDKVLSAPAYSVRALSDGGALIVLSASPFDYLKDPGTFERRRQELKTYLGADAFDSGDPSHSGKIPKFRYFEERKMTIRPKHSEPALSLSHDRLSQVRREDWEKWLQDNPSLTAEFVREMNNMGVVLDFSEESLPTLDAYIRSLNKKKATPSMEILMKVAAYVSQMVIRNTGASWSFGRSDDLPSLRLGDIQVSPLARAQKVFQENETFEHWYRFITRELVPSARSSKTSI
jgi:hypothetical protein